MFFVSKVVLPLIFFNLLNSCAVVRTSSYDSERAIVSARDDITIQGSLSGRSIQGIRRAGIDLNEAIEDGGEFLDMLDFQSAIEKKLIASEINLAKALDKKKKSEVDAIKHFLYSIDLSIEGMFHSECKNAVNIHCDNFKIHYKFALNEVISYLKKNSWNLEIYNSQLEHESEYQLKLNSKYASLHPDKFFYFEPSPLIGIHGLKNRYVRPGIGVSYTACREKNSENAHDEYLPKGGTCVPLTIVIKLIKAEKVTYADIQLFDPTKTKEITFNDTMISLAGDFSAPFARVIESTGITDTAGFFNAMSGSEKLLDQTGFYTVEPYDSSKIPLITVHGLFSSPATWIHVHNELLGDERVRENFQIWHYLYPINLPILENARKFREKLDELNQIIRSTSNANESINNMVVIAHSMGGLLTRTAVSSKSKEFTNYFFLDPDKINELDDDIKKELSRYLDIDRKPYISRVIFIAVPHRGSELSESFLGLIGKKLISIPKAVVAKTSFLIQKTKSIFKPEIQHAFLGDNYFTSIHSLSPYNPTLIALSRVAVDSNIPFHTIVGNQGVDLGIESSDGVVKYTSSHLEGSKSELVVPASHSAHIHPWAINEIKRILHEHLDSIAAQ